MKKKTTPKPVAKPVAKAKPKVKRNPQKVSPEQAPTPPPWVQPDNELKDAAAAFCSEDLAHHMAIAAKADRSVMAHAADTLAEVTRKLETAEDDVRHNKMYYEKALTNAMELQRKFDSLLRILSE